MCFARVPEEEEQLRKYWADLPEGEPGWCGTPDLERCPTCTSRNCPEKKKEKSIQNCIYLLKLIGRLL
jgi:hypothetical protein